MGKRHSGKRRANVSLRGGRGWWQLSTGMMGSNRLHGNWRGARWRGGVGHGGLVGGRAWLLHHRLGMMRMVPCSWGLGSPRQPLVE